MSSSVGCREWAVCVHEPRAMNIKNKFKLSPNLGDKGLRGLCRLTDQRLITLTFTGS
jgi:hypothetical protein